MTHRETARWLAERRASHPLAWNVQAVVGSYERARRGRQVGEHEDGFTVTASKTVAVPVERLYDAFVDAVAARALAARRRAARAHRDRAAVGALRLGRRRDPRPRRASPPRARRRAPRRCRTSGSPTAREAERMKAFWRERVAGLKEVLEP